MAKEKTRKKRLTKKQQIRLSIVAGVIGLLAIVLALIYSQTQKNADENQRYQVLTIQKASPLIFKGTVAAERTEEFYYDQSKGEISKILVENGQEIEQETKLLSYDNQTVQEQVTEQQQTREKLSLEVNSAQQNLDNAYVKKQEFQDKLDTANSNYKNADEATPEGQVIQQEEQAKIEQYKEALSNQETQILQAQQTLDAAYLDLNNADTSIENTENKVTTNILSQTGGVAIVNQQGKTNPAVPVVSIISKETIIEAKATEYDYSRLKESSTVTIRLLHNDSEMKGSITEINPLPDNSEAMGNATQSTIATYTFKVKPAENLQYGYNCQIVLPIDEFRIPEQSFISTEDEHYVFVVEGGKVRKTLVELEEKDGLFILKEGLEEGQKIIENPDDQLSDGQEVTVE